MCWLGAEVQASALCQGLVAWIGGCVVASQLYGLCSWPQVGERLDYHVSLLIHPDVAEEENERLEYSTWCHGPF